MIPVALTVACLVLYLHRSQWLLTYAFPSETHLLQLADMLERDGLKLFYKLKKLYT